MKYKIKSLNLKSKKSSQVAFDSVDVTPNIKHNTYLIYNNQKKDRIVYSFTKSRSDFTSGGAKPYRQKGTGRARMGTNRSPLKVGGSVIFGPKPRVVRRKSNRQFLSSNLQQLLLTKVESSVIFNEFSNVNKVKDVISHIEIDKTYLFVMDVNSPDDVHLFSRIKNIPNIYFNTVNSIVIEDVLRADELIYSDASFKKCFNQEGADND